MKNTPPSMAEKFFGLDYSDTGRIGLSSQDTLRKLVGILGMLLPLLLYIILWVDTGYKTPLESISHYYLTRSCAVLVIIVSLLAIFLLIYKGYKPVDFYVSFIAGIFALCLVLFPTSNISGVDNPEVSVTILKDSPFRVCFHYAASGIFLAALASMSLFIFTMSDQSKTGQTKAKRRRNLLYRICGVIMFAAILVVAAGLFDIISEETFKTYHLTFWMETIAIESFGISWLVKGGAVMGD